MEKKDLELEKQRLDETLGIVRKIVEKKENEAYGSIENIRQLNEENIGNTDVLDQVTNLLEFYREQNGSDKTTSELLKLRASCNKPYFGRIDFEEDGYEKENYYIGINPIFYDVNQYVLDWRAPLASIFYNAKLGKTSYKAPSGIIEGKLTCKRQYKIENGKLVRVLESSDYIHDDELQAVLSKSSSDKMKNIVATIQQEQNEVIRNSTDKNVIVQGGAGSGKTAVALHRIAYLLYQNKNAKSDDFMLITPNKTFGSYVSFVLPELGEENVPQYTIEELIREFLPNYGKFESYDEFLSKYYNGSVTFTEAASNRIKMNADFIDAIDAFADSKINNAVFKEDFKLNKKTINKVFLSLRFKMLGDSMSGKERVESLAAEICSKNKICGKAQRTAVEKNLYNLLMKDITNDPRKLYNEFLSSPYYEKLCGKTDFCGSYNFISYPDQLGMLYLYSTLFDCSKKFDKTKYLIIDEAQDYPQILIKIFNNIFGSASKTILGDVNQTLNPYFRYSELDEMSKVIGNSSFCKLNKAYRSSPEITDYTNSVLNIENVESARLSDDIPVEIKEVSDDELYHTLCEDVLSLKEQGMERVAIVTKNDDEAKKIYDGLSGFIDGLSVLTPDNTVLTDTIVAPSYTSKGLEFDAVICYNDSDKDASFGNSDKHLYYVACTRAQHKLMVYNEPKTLKKSN